MIWDVAVVGGGMSGLVCAIEIKSRCPQKSVVIFERLEKVGKKILATGNGRCNLDNMTAECSDYNNPEFVSSALERFTPESNVAFWKRLGLFCITDSEGRVYPRSNTSSAVLDALRFETERLGIDILFEKVTSLKKHKVFYINDHQATNVIISCGGMSSPSQGSDGSVFPLLEKLGHRITPLFPSLVQITTDTRFTKPLKGVRVKGKLTLREKDKTIGSSEGEILFADYGLSGIATMDLSRFLPQVRSLKDTKIYLDAASDMTKEEIVSYLKERQKINPSLESENLLTGLVPKAFGKAVLKKCNIFPGERAENLKIKEFSAMTETVKGFGFSVTGTKGFDFSQVTSGGVCLSEVDGKTLMSEKVKGLYLCGEVLDVDSRCGGFNLHWAVSSARLAAELKG